MTLEIRAAQTGEEYRACEELQYTAWQMADYREVVPLHLLVAGQKAGGVLLGAFEGEKAVGFVFGFLGRTEEGRLCHYSHMLGIDPKAQGRGIGWQLKVAQREAVLAQGLDLIAWTYDPLEGRNAYLNLGKLGAISRTYICDLYGSLADGLNADLPSDRFQVEWWIASEAVQRRLAGQSGGPSPRPAAWGNVVEWAADGLLAPGRLELAAGERVIGVEIPADYQTIKLRDSGLARAWRLTMRQVLEHYFACGYVAVDFVSEATASGRRSYYILQRD